MRTRSMAALFAMLAAAATFAAEPSAKPTAGPESIVAPNVPGNSVQSFPAVAFNGEVFLVVWQDGSPAPGGGGTDIYAARLDKDGKPLDPAGIAVCKFKEHQEKPAVAACGKDFLVLWQDYRNGKDFDLYSARVTGEGKVLDPDGVLVAGGSGNQVWASVASDGKTGFLAAWMSYDEPKWTYDIRAARFSADGRKLDSADLVVADGPQQQIEPCVARIGDRYALTWVAVQNPGNTTSPCLAWLGADGKISAPTKMSHLGGNMILPSLAGSAKGGLLVQALHYGKIYYPRFLTAAVIKVDGGLLNAAEASDVQIGSEKQQVPYIVAPVDCNPPYGRGIEHLWTAAAPLGGDFLAVWTGRGEKLESYYQVAAARVTADGARCPDRAAPIAIGTDGGVNYLRPAACAGADGGCLIVYERDKAINDYKLAARIVKK